MFGKHECPHCGAVVEKLTYQHMHAKREELTLKCLTMACSKCHKVLGVVPDPWATEADLVTALLRALQSKR